MAILGYLGTGILHSKTDTPCQDAVGWRQTDNGSTVLALSDGASAAGCARAASRTVVAALLAFFARVPLAAFLAKPEGQRRRALLTACRRALDARAAADGQPISRYAATLLVFVTDGTRYFAGQIGDGSLFVLADGRVCRTLAPDSWDGGRRTWFVTSPDGPEHFFTADGQLESGRAAAVLISDGPGTMFRLRGGGRAGRTAEELAGYLRQGNIRTHADLADVLDQMAELPSERLDDWSVLVWCGGGDPPGPLPPEVSMLAVEEEKFARERGAPGKTGTTEEGNHHDGF